MEKNRLDVMMVERGIAGSRSLAQRLIMAGQVRVNGQIAEKPSLKFDNTVKIVLETGPRYISRGGEKLEAGLAAWNLLDLCFSLRVVKCFPFLLPVLMFQAIKPETSLADKPN